MSFAPNLILSCELMEVEAYSTERALRKIKRHPAVAGNVSVAGSDVKEQNKTVEQVGGSELSRHHIERLKVVSEETCSSRSNDNDGDSKSSEQGGTSRGESRAMNFLGGPSDWYGASTFQYFF